MRMLARSVGFITINWLSAFVGANAEPCALPVGFVDTPHPAIAETNKLVSHTEEITVDKPLDQVIRENAKTDLKDAIQKTGPLPGVAGTHQLGDIPFGTTGARRLVCLTDGSTLEEQVLGIEQSDKAYRFRYVVWNYTSDKARPIDYGIGEFRDSEMADARTHIVWTYSFRLKDGQFPGYLGGFGRYLFRVAFLDREYAAMMRATIRGNQSPAATTLLNAH